ncbi:MAG: glutamate--tRNA ligase [Candidatus Magasanikbacteria bacterium]|nr:glutamate--tRNA ligase [Candidatus Magasanikbacteria bacterium]
MIRTRFAPSPTGWLHVGGLRTALYAYLIAKKQGGQFLVRIEDTDRERFVETGTLNILKSLSWAGVVPDEGVVLDAGGKITQKGDLGPYIQSERLAIYKKYAAELLDKKSAYYCFCTSERLEELRKQQELNKLPGGYDGECLKNSTPEDAKKRVAAGEKHVVRLKMPKDGETVWHDLVRGEVSFKNALVDDQVLIKSDGFPTYHLAVVVDDHEMRITHVIRGEEWVSSTPKHIQLYKYFGWEMPEFAHLPLLLNPDKSKLSKRQGDVAVEDYNNKGYLPEALINFVAFLGWNPGTNKEIYSLSELVQDFSLEKVSKSGAVFNLEKLNWFNKEYLKNYSGEKLAELVPEFFVNNDFYHDFTEKLADKNFFGKILDLEKERVTTLAELPAAVKFIFKIPEYLPEILVWRKGTLDEVKIILPELKNYLENFEVGEWNEKNLEAKIKIWLESKKYSTGSVLWPLRVALSGQQNSPGPFEIAAVLGKAESLARLDLAIRKLK